MARRVDFPSFSNLGLRDMPFRPGEMVAHAVNVAMAREQLSELTADEACRQRPYLQNEGEHEPGRLI